MKRLQDCIKYITRRELLPIWIFAAIQVLYHIFMREWEEADAIRFFRNQLDLYSLKDYLAMRYAVWSSRLLIEAVLVYISRNIILWKVIDWLFWVFLAWSLIWLFPKEKREMAAYVVVGFLLIYPMWDLRTAGWVATSVNYTWPFALGVFSLHGTARAFYGQKTPAGLCMLYAIAAVYGANMEQMSAVLLTVNFCAIVYFILQKEKIRLYVGTLVGFFIALAELIFILTCPGNAARKSQEIVNWLPNFATYNLLDKVSMGFVDTMHHLIASGNLMYLCYVIFLAILIFLKTKEMKYRLAAVIPVALNVCIVGFSDMLENYFPTFSDLMETNAFICGSNYHIAANYMPTLLYLLVIGCMLLSLSYVCESYFELFGQGMLLALALATRVIMGFTPTIYVSQERTFFYLYMILGVSAVFLLQKNKELIKEHGKMYDTLKFAGILFMTAGIIANLTEIGNV